MDLTGFELELVGRRAQVAFADAGGDKTRTLTGAAYDRIESAAAALLAAIEMRVGGACHLELTSIGVDTVARVMRVGVGEPEPKRFEGAGYDGLAAAIADVARVAMGEVRQRKPDPAGTASDASFWAGLYHSGGDNWELARATPPLARWCASHPVSGLRTLVVGCGRGHEARLLARLGADVVGIDFAPEAVAEARALAAKDNVSIDFRERDLFALRDDPERYDLVVEHCCFCAVEPRRRPEYVEAMADVLVPGGRLIGLFYAHGRPGGPPFTVTKDELERHFSARFRILHLEVPPDSIAVRNGQELLVEFERNPSTT